MLPVLTTRVLRIHQACPPGTNGGPAPVKSSKVGTRQTLLSRTRGGLLRVDVGLEGRASRLPSIRSTRSRRRNCDDYRYDARIASSTPKRSYAQCHGRQQANLRAPQDPPLESINRRSRILDRDRRAMSPMPTEAHPDCTESLLCHLTKTLRCCSTRAIMTLDLCADTPKCTRSVPDAQETTTGAATVRCHPR